GSAQRCERGTHLQHGSILLSGSQSRVRDLLTAPGSAGAAEGSITLEDLVGRAPAVADLEAALSMGFEMVFGTRLAPGTLIREEIDRVHELTRHYQSDDWTWRR